MVSRSCETSLTCAALALGAADKKCRVEREHLLRACGPTQSLLFNLGGSFVAGLVWCAVAHWLAAPRVRSFIALWNLAHLVVVFLAVR